MQCPYPKPCKLSDPFYDWFDCEDQLTEILAKSPRELTCEDYGVIFARYQPAADYEEGCYYIDPYLDYLSEATALEARGCESFFWYVDHFADRFARDGLLEPIRERLWECFLKLTASFKVVRLTDVELERLHYCPSCREFAYLTRTIPDILDGITEWQVFKPTLSKLQAHFHRPLSVTHSHWFCELAYHTRSWLVLGCYPTVLRQTIIDKLGGDFLDEPIVERQTVFDFFHRFDRFGSHYGNILNSKITEGFFEYNRRLISS